MSFNKITIVGYLGRDPELRYTAQGTAVCKMSIATTEKRKNVAGQTEEHTTWFRVTAWGRQAELSNEYLSKGRQVYIEGRLRLEEYTDREGNVRLSPEVNATEVQFLGQRTDTAEKPEVTAERNSQTRPEETATQPEASPAKAHGKAKNRAPQKELVSIEEDDIPF
ncbi:MAG: single-stranded DNA-binding protein [Acidobacteria bacterium]|nr:single-stranded DNA-binding protein [Acidobacteriota bacterium]